MPIKIREHDGKFDITFVKQENVAEMIAYRTPGSSYDKKVSDYKKDGYAYVRTNDSRAKNWYLIFYRTGTSTRAKPFLSFAFLRALVDSLGSSNSS